MDFLRRVLPQNLEQYLEGIDFPISKEDLLGKLEENGVPGAAVNQLREQLPEGEYQGPGELLDALRR